MFAVEKIRANDNDVQLVLLRDRSRPRLSTRAHQSLRPPCKSSRLLLDVVTMIADVIDSVSSYHLLPIARDLVRRWANEIQSAIEGKSSGGFMGFGGSSQLPTQTSYHAQYLAVGLLCKLDAVNTTPPTTVFQRHSCCPSANSLRL
jgi:hypothetical protein